LVSSNHLKWLALYAMSSKKNLNDATDLLQHFLHFAAVLSVVFFQKTDFSVIRCFDFPNFFDMERMSDGPLCALQRFQRHREFASILKIRIFNIVGEKRQKTTGALSAVRHRLI
jgi:hypothetical protein